MTRLFFGAAAAVLTVCLPVVRAGTLTGTSGDLNIALAGQVVTFAPDGPNNLTITGDFAGATVGVPFPAQITLLNLVSAPVQFMHGTYIIGLQLEPLTNSLGQVTETSGSTFTSFFDVFFDASFLFTAPGSLGGGDPDSGDILGEFGSLPGISNCVNGAGTSTCELRHALTVSGSFSADLLRDVTVSAVPEPATLLLAGSALLLFGFFRRK